MSNSRRMTCSYAYWVKGDDNVYCAYPHKPFFEYLKVKCKYQNYCKELERNFTLRQALYCPNFNKIHLISSPDDIKSGKEPVYTVSTDLEQVKGEDSFEGINSDIE